MSNDVLTTSVSAHEPTAVAVAATAPTVTATPQPSRQFMSWVGLLAMSAVAVAFTAFLWSRGGIAVAPLATAALLAGSTLALPGYSRWRSWRPVRGATVLVGAVLLAAVTGGGLTVPDLRWGLLAVLAVLAVPILLTTGTALRRAPQPTLLVGDRASVVHLIAQWGAIPDVDIAGICLTQPHDDSGAELESVCGVPVLGGLHNVAQVARATGVRQVVVAPGPVVTAYDVRRLSWALENSHIELAVATEVHGAVPRRIEPRLVGRRLLLSVGPTRRPVASVLVKAAIDRVGAALLLVVLAPVMAAIAVAVRLDSPGPALFRQSRAGRHGEAFTMFKFRTMTADAESVKQTLAHLNEAGGPLFKIRDDPRVTRVGRLLRASSLDELPQLINVLNGTMSLIGPRPALLDETDQYDHWISRRLAVRPGMTGLWQVSGRSGLGWNEAVRLDIDYVDNWTLSGDMGIARKTLNAVLRREGAF